MSNLLEAILYKPILTTFENEGIYFFLDDNTPNWLAVDERGKIIFDIIDGKRKFGDIVREYSTVYGFDAAQSWLHVHDFIKNAMRYKMVSSSPFNSEEYRGRENYLKPSKLNEFWIHTNNSCNLTCTHCLVESSPSGDPGLPGEEINKVIDEAGKLGVFRYYFTGGEPFVRKDIFDLMKYATEEKGGELIVLTNATLFKNGNKDKLKALDRKRVRLQVSLDGSSPEINDPIRGKGAFNETTEGLKAINELGFDTSLTSVVTSGNIHDVANLPVLAKKLGAKSIHLMWMHMRGRATSQISTTHYRGCPEFQISTILRIVREVKEASDEAGIIFDNYESLKMRVNGRPGVKYDLGNACWDTLCLYSNGCVYPSASFAGYEPLNMGNTSNIPLRAIWLNSTIARDFRSATVIKKPWFIKDPFRFITGGGDIEHSFFFSTMKNGNGNILGDDPYYGVYTELVKDIMKELAKNGRDSLNKRSGYNIPIIYHAMGENTAVCGMDTGDVRTLHSNCVLSFDVEKPYRVVQEFYSKAADEPKADLCCPIKYDDADIRHIPEEVLKRFYGCGSPITMADVSADECVLDLGSGGGIDCFIAAKRVGKNGRVIGVDMTEKMLEIANKNKVLVADNLGYDVVEFKKGFLEKLPVEDKSIDLITSNCVINLSPNKKVVFSEMWRVLKDHGRIVVSDIVSEKEIPLHLKVNEQLWGECMGGALTEDEFLSYLEQVGFYGVEVLKRTYWKDVKGYKFYSVTVRGYKFEKKEGCVYIGQKAVYRGPFKAVVDEEGHLFSRDEIVEVCTDTSAKLKNPPYNQFFTIIEPDGEGTEFKSCEPGDGKCC
ncbi:MAG: methyltransferase domain-containing protein [Nitrospinae bacterium]|nr:methyltransferase domain-containing protein [Nitrospinota bacterium]